MSQVSLKKDDLDAKIKALEDRILQLENELTFVKEHGMSEEEQDIVLDRNDSMPGMIAKPQLVYFLIVNLCLILWCTYLTFRVWFDEDSPPTVQQNEFRSSTKIQGKNSTGTSFKLPPRGD